MIYNNLKRILYPFELRLLFLKSLYNGEEFLIIDIVIIFLRRVLYGKVGDGVKLVIIVVLE